MSKTNSTTANDNTNVVDVETINNLLLDSESKNQTIFEGSQGMAFKDFNVGEYNADTNQFEKSELWNALNSVPKKSITINFIIDNKEIAKEAVLYIDESGHPLKFFGELAFVGFSWVNASGSNMLFVVDQEVLDQSKKIEAKKQFRQKMNK